MVKLFIFIVFILYILYFLETLANRKTGNDLFHTLTRYNIYTYENIFCFNIF